MFIDLVAETIITRSIRTRRKRKNKMKKIDKKMKNKDNLDHYFTVVTLD